MKYVNDEFSGLSSFDGPAEVSDHDFLRCHFFNVAASPRPNPRSRLYLRRITLTRCTHWNCSLVGAALEDIVVDNLKRRGPSPLFFWDCAFRRVTLRGPISFFKINARVDLDANSSRSRDFRAANIRFYQDTDWAIDTSEAQFGGLVDFPGIPPQLIRRDPSTQFVLQRNSAQYFLEPSYPLDVWSLIAADLLKGSDDGIMVALGKRAKTFSRDLERAQELHYAGFLA